MNASTESLPAPTIHPKCIGCERTDRPIVAKLCGEPLCNVCNEKWDMITATLAEYDLALT